MAGVATMTVRAFIVPCRRTRSASARALLLCALAALAVAPCFAATTYKWVDEQGQVHYSDTPPATRNYEIVESATGPSVTPPVRAEPQPEAPRPPSPTIAQTRSGEADDARCVDALFQLKLLAMQVRVFKPGPGGSRLYLGDRDRPAEVERLARVRDESCSDQAEKRRSQEFRASEMLRVLSPACTAAREKLQAMEDPDSHTVRSDLDRQRAYVGKYCADVRREDVWLGDWMYVQQRR
jgi:hypothetical protein